MSGRGQRGRQRGGRGGSQRSGRGRGRGQVNRGRGGRRGGSRGRGGSRARREPHHAGSGLGWTSSGAEGWGVGEKGETNDCQPTAQLDVDKIEDLRNFFTSTTDFEQHYEAQEKNKSRYVAGMAVLEKNGVEVSANARVRALAAAWARHDQALATSLLANRERYGLVEVLKALTLLDSARRIRVEEKRMKRLQLQTSSMLKPTVMGKFKSNIDNLTALKPKRGSASGAVCRHVKQWVRGFTEQQLEFYALHFPTEPWRKLADICHFHPKKDFPALEWFLPFCYGTPAPDVSAAAQCRHLSGENVNELLQEFSLPYSHVRPHSGQLTEESKAKIAATDRLDQVIWWYEDLQCQEVDDIVDQRLQAGEQLNLPYGKLMERLLTFKLLRENRKEEYWVEDWAWDDTQASTMPQQQQQQVEDKEEVVKAKFITHLIPLAERQLKQTSLTLEAPVVVIGDRSGSMDVAIRTSTIIASLLTALCSAKLVFFDHENMDAPFIPTNIEEVLEMAATIRTGGSTIPAASLWPFYERKEVVKTFIIVTDEGENGECQDYSFARLFKKYREEVHPARLVFVSFLYNQHEVGYMLNQLREHGVTDNIMQFKFDQNRPDLTKLDKLFGLLSSETDSFEEQVREMEADIEVQGLEAAFQVLNVNDRENSEITRL